MAWPSAPLWGADDAALDVIADILARGKASRLYQRMVYREQAAQSVGAFQISRELAGVFQVTAQAREGFNLSQMESAIQEELTRLANEGPTERELQRTKNGAESAAVQSIQNLLGKADRLNSYATFRGQPDLFNQDLARYQKVTAADVKRVVKTYLLRPRVVLSMVPKGRRDLAAGGATP
jgi:zinc protease